MIRLERNTRDRDETDIPEDIATLSDISEDREWQNWIHHDTSPDTQETWFECVGWVEPETSEILIDRISKIGIIQRSGNREKRLYDDDWIEKFHIGLLDDDMV